MNIPGEVSVDKPRSFLSYTKLPYEGAAASNKVSVNAPFTAIPIASGVAIHGETLDYEQRIADPVLTMTVNYQMVFWGPRLGSAGSIVVNLFQEQDNEPVVIDVNPVALDVNEVDEVASEPPNLNFEYVDEERLTQSEPVSPRSVMEI